jgi:hypothetical protein
MGLEGIGARVVRKEDKRFITGRGKYTDDMIVPGMHHAAFRALAARPCPDPLDEHGESAVHAGGGGRPRRDTARADGSATSSAAG